MPIFRQQIELCILAAILNSRTDWNYRAVRERSCFLYRKVCPIEIFLLVERPGLVFSYKSAVTITDMTAEIEAPAYVPPRKFLAVLIALSLTAAHTIRLARANGVTGDRVDVLERELEVDGSQNRQSVVSSAKNRVQRLELEHQPVANSEWASLARTYFSQKQYDEGTAAMLHALQMPNGDSFNFGVYHSGNLRGDLGFALLLQAKQYADAEKILKQCIEMRKSSKYGKNAHIEKAFLAELFIDQGKFDEAKRSLSHLGHAGTTAQ